MSTNGTTHLNLKDNYVQIINGKSAPTQKSHQGINPATLEKKPEVPVATQDDLNNAVDAARKAFKSWSRVPWEERRQKLYAWADAVEAQKKEFADLLISEQGKPVSYQSLFPSSFKSKRNPNKYRSPKLLARRTQPSRGSEAKLASTLQRKSSRIVRIERSLLDIHLLVLSLLLFLGTFLLCLLLLRSRLLWLREMSSLSSLRKFPSPLFRQGVRRPAAESIRDERPYVILDQVLGYFIIVT